MAHVKGTITKSKRFEKPKDETINTLETVTNVASTIGNTVQGIASAVQATTDNFKSVGKGLRSIRNSFTDGSSLVTDDHNKALDKASQLANEYGLESIELRDYISGNPYQASDLIPEMKAADANREKLKIQRQNNALEVRLERIKQSRKVVAIASEERRLHGDLVDYQTVEIETATKVIKNQIADTKYRTEQSKLEQFEELLEQQQIATQGTLNLTNGIRQEWELKAENQQAKNTRLRLEIEGTISENERRREELEAKLLSESV